MAMSRRGVRNSAHVPVHGSEEVEELSRQIQDIRRGLPDFCAGSMLTVSVSGAATQKVRHGLGRRIKGWWVARIQSVTARTVTETDADESSLTLSISGACELQIWVF
jgi:hypothetical protein